MKENAKLMAGRISSLETDLVKARQELGEALNRENDQETKNVELIELLRKNGIKDSPVKSGRK